MKRIVLYTSLGVDDCIEKLQSASVKCNKANLPKPLRKYYFPNGRPMISTEINGTAFTSFIRNRNSSKWPETLQFHGILIQDQDTGGTRIEGRFVSSRQAIIRDIAATISLAIPLLFVLSVLTLYPSLRLVGQLAIPLAVCLGLALIPTSLTQSWKHFYLRYLNKLIAADQIKPS
jgi:hypothetical protein